MKQRDKIRPLTSALPSNLWTQDADIIAPYMVEWREKYHGHTPLMLRPETTEHVSDMVKICAAHNIKLVPQGGNTGLVGGQTPQGEVLISLNRMTAIDPVNPIENAVIAQAGATLLSVQKAADKANRKFPLSLASEGSCTIGGNLSTNAGGVHVLKYGTSKDLVFGVEAVLANGEIYNGLTSLRKDNTGYDLSRLFLGAEGTLGIITKASLKLFPKPAHIQRVMVGLDSPLKALELLELCRDGDHLAMFEVLPHIGLNAVIQNIPNQRDPFLNPHPWYALIDWEVDTEHQAYNLAESKLSKAMALDIIRDSVIAQSQNQAAALLGLRENMSAGQKFLGGSIKFDITVPLSDIPAFLTRADAAVGALIPGARPIAFGHFGDGNIHYNIAQPVPNAHPQASPPCAPDTADKTAFLENWDAVSKVIFDVVDAFNGSISAEHGIGIMKKDDLARRSDPVKLALLKALKSTLDPQNIMNPRVMV